MDLKTYIDRYEPSVSAFAEKIEVTSAAVHFWISGKRTPSSTKALKIAEVTSGVVTPNDFMKFRKVLGGRNA